MSTLRVRRAVAEMSPLTREVLDRLNLLHAQHYPFEKKQAIQEAIMRMLTPEQKADVAAEALKCAMDLQFYNPNEGNRAARRRARAERGRARRIK